MKLFLISFMALLLSFPGALSRKPLPEGSAGEYSYDVHYKLGVVNTKMATCTLNQRPATWEGQPAWSAVFRVRAAHVFRLFIRDEYRVNLHLSKQDLQPYHYEFPYKEKGKDYRLEFFYGTVPGKVESLLYSADGKEPVRKTFPAPDGMAMDLASMAFFLRSLDFGSFQGPLRMHVIMSAEYVPVVVNYKGVDASYWPGETAHHIVVNMPERGLMENGDGNEIHVWISGRREILGLSLPIGKGTVSARLKRQ